MITFFLDLHIYSFEAIFKKFFSLLLSFREKACEGWGKGKSEC